jgi:hypothetical protein
MTEPPRISIWFLSAIALFMLVVIFNVTLADDGHGHNHDSTDTDVSSVVTNSDSSRAYGLGFGNADIAQCYRSYQILIWQDSKINPICLADSYDAKGLHKMAAIIRCDIGTIRKHFTSDKLCLNANTMQINDPLPPVADLKADLSATENERIELLYARLSDLETQRQSDTANARKAAIRANTAAQRANQAEIDRKEYAQQMYNELKEWNESDN